MIIHVINLTWDLFLCDVHLILYCTYKHHSYTIKHVAKMGDFCLLLLHIVNMMRDIVSSGGGVLGAYS
jgi:hypothetical protein